MRKFFIIAGEASGDLHGSNLIAEIKKIEANADFQGWGGEKMKAEGLTLKKHYRELAFMGFIEVILNLRTILKNIELCKAQIAAYQPEALILIDYPGFNMRIAKWAKSQGIRVFYYISPQVWAWKKSRVWKLKKTVDRMFTILPFEREFYAQYGMDVEYVGHPLLDEIKKENIEPLNFEKPVIALLPGSRKQEVSQILPMMLAAVKDKEDYCIVLAMAPSLNESFYREIIGNHPIELMKSKTYSVLKSAKFALVTSGTATLETALFEVPQVVCYKGNFLSYLIAKWLVNIKFISLVNLIMDKEVVKELIQGECTSKRILEELEKLENEQYSDMQKTHYQNLKKKLGGQGASKLTALTMLKNMD